MKKLILLLFVFTAALQSFGQVDPRLRKIDSLMNYFTANNKFMGSVSIRYKNNLVFNKAYGFSSVDKRTEATPATKYKIGAVSNMFTAAVIFQLFEEKKLKPETKLSQYYPQIKNADSSLP